VPLILLVPFRTPRGGKRLGGGFLGSFLGSAGERYAATRRATRVARNTWPVSASMTAMARLPFPAAVKSPYPKVVNVVKLKYWNVWVQAVPAARARRPGLVAVTAPDWPPGHGCLRHDPPYDQPSG
jgi:hypothetical protein